MASNSSSPLSHRTCCVADVLERGREGDFAGWQTAHRFVRKHSAQPPRTAGARANAQAPSEHGSSARRANVEARVPGGEPHAAVRQCVDVRRVRRRVPRHTQVTHAQICERPRELPDRGGRAARGCEIDGSVAAYRLRRARECSAWSRRAQLCTCHSPPTDRASASCALPGAPSARRACVLLVS